MSAKKTAKDKTAAKKESFFIGNIFRQSWKILKKDWPTLLGFYGLFIAVMLLYTWYGSDTGPITALLYMVFQLIYGMVLIKVFVLLSQEKRVGLNIIKEVAPRILKYLGAVLLQVVIVLFGIILLILPGIIWGIKYSFTPYLVIDQGLGPIDALKKSAEMTDGVKWDLVGFYAAAAALTYVGIFGLLIGLIVTLPLAMLAYAGLYNRLLERVEC